LTCQRFLTGLMTTPDEKLAGADPAKLAAKYGLIQCPKCGGEHGGVEWAEMCLRRWRMRG